MAASKTEEERTDERGRALKERIYASFTGLAILAAASIDDHTTALHALEAVAVGVFGISVAGFLAEVVAHQVTHRRLPVGRELGVMAQIALIAFASALAPILVLAASCLGWLTVEHALWVGVIVYALTLVLVIVLASFRAGLRPLQQLVSSAMLVGLALVVVAVLTLAH